MSTPPPEAAGDAAYLARERVRRRTSLLVQGAFVLVLVGLLAWLAVNVSSNLKARQIRAGFDFLFAPAGFNIGESVMAFDSADSYLAAFMAGVLNTLRVALAAVLLATVCGVTIGLARLSHHPMVRGFAGLWVQLSRNIPLLIQLLALYLVFTEWFPDATEPWHLGSGALFSKQGLQLAAPVHLDAAVLSGLGLGAVAAWAAIAWPGRGGDQSRSLMAQCIAAVAALALGMAVAWVGAGVIGGWSSPEVDGLSIVGGAALSPEFIALWIGLSFFTSGAIAEIVRAGAQAVPVGQWHAGLALGMTRSQMIGTVVFPQALRLAIPPLASQYMNLIKNSSLAVVIGYPDIVSIANTAINQNGQALECIVIIMTVYLAINLVVSLVMNALNARVTRAPR
ncbi:MAG: transporter permease [Rhodoferax sp.]|nr:transporter permease [Rhodoferax sp.]